MDYNYQVWEVNKKIQKNVKAFGVEGIFLFFLMAWLIICFILLIILRSLFDVVTASIIALALFLIAVGICSYFSKQFGIRMLIEKIGSTRQPDCIFSNHKHFQIRRNEIKKHR